MGKLMAEGLLTWDSNSPIQGCVIYHFGSSATGNVRSMRTRIHLIYWITPSH
jgi:hypothetical protein